MLNDNELMIMPVKDIIDGKKIISYAQSLINNSKNTLKANISYVHCMKALE